jgi:hypothetical protein
MSTATYTRLEQTAQRLIKQYGFETVLRRAVKSGPEHNPVVNDTELDVIAVETGYKITTREQSLIQTGDKVGLISTETGTVPDEADRIVIGGQEFKFVDLKPLNLGGTITLLYEFIARR